MTAKAQPIYVRQKAREALHSLAAPAGSLRERVGATHSPLSTLQAHGIADDDLMRRLEAILTLLREDAPVGAGEASLSHLTDDEVRRAWEEILSFSERAIEWAALHGARITE